MPELKKKMQYESNQHDQDRDESRVHGYTLPDLTFEEKNESALAAATGTIDPGQLLELALLHVALEPGCDG